MRYLVPQFILEKNAQQIYSGQFNSVSLFVDVSGFSKVTTTLMKHGNEAAEMMSDIMDAIFEPLVTAVYEHGGFITTFAGDAFTALFLTDDLDEKSAYLQALATAESIQQHLKDNPIQDTPYGKFSFTVKLGIGAGDVRWGIFKDTDQENPTKSVYFFSGQAIDEASEAEHYATSGNLIITSSVHHQLSSDVSTIAAGDDGHQRVLSINIDLPDPHPISQMEPIGQEEFIPDSILRRNSRGEFRQVISVFINLMGIDTVQQLESFVRSAFTIHKKYGGYLSRIDFGDKGCNFLMFWGMPTSHENDITRALNSLLELPTYTPGTFKAGVTYQTLFACFAGSHHRAEFTTYGGGVSLAARLMVKAPWGDVWLDEATQKRAERYYELSHAGAYLFKGFDAEQPVFALIEPKQQRVDEFFQGQMVGREEELQRLREFIDPILQPADSDQSPFAGMCVVAGGAGLGKSRLIHAFREQLDKECEAIGKEIDWIWGQTNQLIKEPMSPFRYSMMEEFGIKTTASDTVNKRAFSSHINEVIAEIKEVDPEAATEIHRLRSFYGALLGLEWENSLYSQSDPESRQGLLYHAMQTMMQARSKVRPLIVVMEDVHWIDPETRTFAETMVGAMFGNPIAILGTVRPDELDEKTTLLSFPGVNMEFLPLMPLDAEALANLAENILGDPVGKHILDILMKRSEGNPFFAEQILLYLKQQADIQLVNGVWMLTDKNRKDVPLPGDLRAIFIARLDQLTQEVRDVVQAAAVLGREFEIDILASMLNEEAQLEEKILQAEQETVWSALSQVRYLFQHALLRDAAYSMQLRARRRVLHQLAAETLEKVHVSDLSAYTRDIAYHYEQAYLQGVPEVADKALYYLFQSAQQSAEAYQHELAIDYFTRCLEMVRALDEEKRFDILLARSKVYNNFHAFDLEQQDLQELSQIANSSQLPSKQAEVALQYATSYTEIGQFSTAKDYANQAINYAQSSQEVGIEAKANILLAVIAVPNGEFEYIESYAHQAINLAKAVNDRDTEAEGLYYLGFATYLRTYDVHAASEYYQKALVIHEQTGNLRKEGEVRLTTVEIADNEASFQALKRVLNIARDVGDKSLEARVYGQVAVYHSWYYDFPEMFANYHKAIKIFQDIKQVDFEGVVYFHLAMNYLILGDLESSRQYADKALSIGLEHSIYSLLYQCSIVHRHLYAEYDDKSQFSELLSDFNTYRSPSSHKSSIYMGDVWLTYTHTIANQLEQAREHFDTFKHLIYEASEDSFARNFVAEQSFDILTYLMADNRLDEAQIVAEIAWQHLHEIVEQERFGLSMFMYVYLQLHKLWLVIDDKRAAEALNNAYVLIHEIGENLSSDDERVMLYTGYSQNRNIIENYHAFHNIPLPDFMEESVPERVAPETSKQGHSQSSINEDIPVVIGETQSDEQPTTSTQAKVSLEADEKAPVIIHIDAEDSPKVQTSVIRREDSEPMQSSQRPIFHVTITIENTGTIHNLNIYQGENHEK